MIRIETVLLAEGEESTDWLRPERMIALDRATLSPGDAAHGNIPGAVLLEMGRTTVFDESYDTNVYVWWSSFLEVLESLSKAPKSEEEMHFPDQPLKMKMRRSGDRVTCSLDYRNSRTKQRVQVSGSGPFDELLRKSLDEAERFYLRIIELDPGDAEYNSKLLEECVSDRRRRLGVSRWTDPVWMRPGEGEHPAG